LPGGKAGTAPRAALHDNEAGQTCACAQARPASLNNQVTAMRGRQSNLAPRMRRQHWRPFAMVGKNWTDF